MEILLRITITFLPVDNEYNTAFQAELLAIVGATEGLINRKGTSASISTDSLYILLPLPDEYWRSVLV